MSASSATPARILLDTDMGSDCDDAGALAVMHALADQGEAVVVACGYSSGRRPWGAGCIEAINTYYGRPEIPIGAYQADDIGDPCEYYAQAIAENTARYGHKRVANREFPDLVTVYRRALAAEADGAVTVVSIGHNQGLHDLLHSQPDEASPLSGLDLVAAKVGRWIVMGGQFPASIRPTWNFACNGALATTASVIARWPTPVVFVGDEAGATMITGRSLQATSLDNPVREAYRLWNRALEEGRPSWDLVTVLYAVRGLGDRWTLQTGGRCEIDNQGGNTWIADSAGRHAYLVRRAPDEAVARLLDTLLAQPPRPFYSP